MLSNEKIEGNEIWKNGKSIEHISSINIGTLSDIFIFLQSTMIIKVNIKSVKLVSINQKNGITISSVLIKLLIYDVKVREIESSANPDNKLLGIKVIVDKIKNGSNKRLTFFKKKLRIAGASRPQAKLVKYIKNPETKINKGIRKL